MIDDYTTQNKAHKARLSKKLFVLELLLKPLITFGARQMITQLLDKAGNIAQTQTNNAKRNLFSMCIALLVAGLGAIVFLMGIIAIAFAVFISLDLVLPTSAACAVVGVILLLISCILALSAKSISPGKCCQNRYE